MNILIKVYGLPERWIPARNQIDGAVAIIASAFPGYLNAQQIKLIVVQAIVEDIIVEIEVFAEEDIPQAYLDQLAYKVAGVFEHVYGHKCSPLAVVKVFKINREGKVAVYPY